MVNVLFYKEKIKELKEHLEDAVLSVCSTAADIERTLGGSRVEEIRSMMERLSYGAATTAAFANSIYYLSRLLREKTQA